MSYLPPEIDKYMEEFEARAQARKMKVQDGTATSSAIEDILEEIHELSERASRIFTHVLDAFEVEKVRQTAGFGEF